MEQNAAHISLAYVEGTPSNLTKAFLDDVSAPGLQVDTSERREAIYASIEWTIPTLIIVFVASNYFQGFLSEAGKHHYEKLASALSKLAKRAHKDLGQIEPRRYSPTFSVQAETKDGRAVKFTFPTGATTEEYASMVSVLLRMLEKEHSMSKASNQNLPFSEAQFGGRILYLEYDLSDDSWKPIKLHTGVETQRK